MIAPAAAAKPRILVAPLDWGLGHATRSIPIIRELIQQGCEVILAAEGNQKLLLQQEFPELTVINLQGYQVKYSSHKFLLPFRIIGQLPKILRIIKEENRWLKNVIHVYDINAVISDNRFGLYHSIVPCVFITHQLLVKVHLRLLEKLVQKINYSFINRFTECWIPDFSETPNLSGDLSHPTKLPLIPVKYLGPLTRFSNRNEPSAGGNLVILLSGPEPQRTILEKKLLKQLESYSGPVTLVRGLPGDHKSLFVPAHVRAYDHLPSGQLEQLLSGASFVISRSGYSTIMDLVKLDKKSILIPTPGQTEQEYLSIHLLNSKLALSIPQDKFQLQMALSMAESFPYQLPGRIDDKNFKGVISSFVASLTRNLKPVSSVQ